MNYRKVEECQTDRDWDKNNGEAKSEWKDHTILTEEEMSYIVTRNAN